MATTRMGCHGTSAAPNGSFAGKVAIAITPRIILAPSGPSRTFGPSAASRNLVPSGPTRTVAP